MRYSPALLDALEVAWRQHPEERLGQFILNLTRNENGSVDQHRLWNMENEEFIRLLIDSFHPDAL